MRGAFKEISHKRWNDETSASRYAERSDALSATGEKREWQAIITDMVGSEPKKVLDVGTGAGLLALLYAELGHDATGLDFSEAMLEAARRRSERMALPCSFVHGDAESLPFEDGTFDVVTNRIMIWSLPNPGVAAREWARVLRPGGKVVLFGNHPDEWPLDHQIMRRIRPYLPRKNKSSGHADSFMKNWRRTLDEFPFQHAPAPKIKALFDAAGLVETEITTIQHRIGGKKGLGQRLRSGNFSPSWHVVSGTKPQRSAG